MERRGKGREGKEGKGVGGKGREGGERLGPRGKMLEESPVKYEKYFLLWKYIKYRNPTKHFIEKLANLYMYIIFDLKYKNRNIS